MNYNKKSISVILLSLLIALFSSGCSQTKSDNNNNEISSSIENSSVSIDNVNNSEMFSDKDKEIGYDESTAISISFSNNSTKCDYDTVKISGNTVTITDEGTYILSGALDNGQIVVDAEKTDKLQLVLNGVNINCDSSAAIYIKQADKVFITLVSDTINSLSNKSEFISVDDNSIDSVVFSKDDLTINGAGKLIVNAAYGHGIVSKDDLVITGGSYDITAENHAISGNDSVRIADGNFTLSSGKDGVQSENADDVALGFVYISGGSFEIASDGDGISASAVAQIENGTFRINAGGGSQNKTTNHEEMARPNERTQPTTTTPTDTIATIATTTVTETVSTKGIKATGHLIINGGEITIDSADDALHSNTNLVITDGIFTLSSGDDGAHADANVTISGGNLIVTKSYEGIEGKSIDLTGGIISVTASDDGINAAGGNDQSGFGGGMGKDNFSDNESSYIKISGGTINVNASGDGIDSNGGLYVSGGETYVCGPTNSGNGALDYNGEAQITGGIFVAVSSSGMTQNFNDTSTQGAILVNISINEANAELSLKDSLGNIVLSYTPQKAYSSVIVSCPQINKGEHYTLEVGSQSTAIEMTSLIYGSGGGLGEKPRGGMNSKENVG